MLSKASKCTPPAHIIATNKDLITQILLRLPTTSLLRFKSVSKHWLSLISSPHFCLLRNNKNSNTSSSGLFLHRSSALINPEFDFVPFNHENSTPPPFRRLTFVDDPNGLRILQSCNGLLCCCSYRSLGTKNYCYIYNPTTNKFTTLPEPSRRPFRFDSSSQSVRAVNLAFDPSKSPHYKVIYVHLSDQSPELYEIEIYSSETGIWTPSGDPFPADVNFKLGVFWNGAMNWISTWGDSLYFDLDEELLQTMPMPPVPNGWEEKRRLRYFGQSCDHLHLIEIYGPRTTQFNVYEMERDYSKWVVKYRIDLDTITSVFPQMIRSHLDPSDLHYYGFTLLSVVRRERDDESFLVLHIFKRLYASILRTRPLRNFVIFLPVVLILNSLILRVP